MKQQKITFIGTTGPVGIFRTIRMAPGLRPIAADLL
jgi:hypothetical protein